MRKFLDIYEEAVSYIWLCNCSLPNFLINEENFIFFFMSVASNSEIMAFLGKCYNVTMNACFKRFSTFLYAHALKGLKKFSCLFVSKTKYQVFVWSYQFTYWFWMSECPLYMWKFNFGNFFPLRTTMDGHFHLTLEKINLRQKSNYEDCSNKLHIQRNI